MKKYLLLLPFLFFFHLSNAQFHFGIGGGGSWGVGDLSPFSSTGFNAYIELSHEFNDKMEAGLMANINGFVAIPLDASLSQAWYQVPIMVNGRYLLISRDKEKLFHPYVQAGLGAVKSYYLKGSGPNLDPELVDDFWKFGFRGGFGAKVYMFNLQINYLYGGKFDEYVLGGMELTVGLYF
ncbi:MULTISPECIES: hypothetical protein [Flammeovirga]|uniref:Outer membrane protein beta-barrel domain-containing protein n=1 Tax=Flammeovirga agarivorans TaxID=2726742 RepID=A0A7X8SGS5_9BACT|nr:MULTISPECIES: hypothetical protein [Flammeovirga]NLR89964.1 hypothetical protein [Flammeovirga agarivorans]